MRIIAFSHSNFIPGEAAILKDILPLVDGLHIRKNDSLNDRNSFVNWNRLLDGLPENQRHKVWIHDHYELAIQFHLGGIHLSRKSLKANKGLGVYAALHSLDTSASCHDLKDAASLIDLYERVFICPLFDSISKRDHKSGFDLNQVKNELSKERNTEVIALGGVAIEHVDTIEDLGFDGLALLGSLWQANDPIEYLEAINHQCRRLKSTY